MLDWIFPYAANPKFFAPIRPTLSAGGVGNAASIEAAIEKAAGQSFVLLGAQTVLDRDVVMTVPAHVVVHAGAVLTMADGPAWQHGVHRSDRSAYYAGMFTCRPGAERSVFEVYGTFDLNDAGAGAVNGALFYPAGVLQVGLTKALTFPGAQNFALAYGARTFIGSVCYARL